MRNLAIINAVLFIFLLAGCNDKPDSELGHNEKSTISEKIENGVDSIGEEGHNEEEGIVHISRQQAETIGLETKILEERNLGNNIKITGSLELFPQDKANISPFLGGNVRSIKVIEGDKVSKGEVLAYLEHPDIISMQQEYQEKNDELVFLKQDFERKQTLFDKGVSSGKEFQMAQSKFRTTTSSVNGLKSKLQLLGINTSKVEEGEIYSAIPITSPISGFVDEIMVSLGDYVAPQTKMFAVSDNSEIHLDLKVYEKDVSMVQVGQEVYFTVAAKPNQILKGKIHAIGKTFETDPKALHAHAEIQNDDRELLPGMYVEGRIVQGVKMVKAVPEEAIVKNGVRSFIFILDEDETEQEENKLRFRMIPVSTGLSDLGFVEINIAEQLSENVKIVTKGAYMLSSEMIKSELGDDD